MKFTIFIIMAFIVWFSSIWVAVLSLLSFIGGWKYLARFYPLKSTDKESSASKFFMCSIKMGYISYRSCINISLTQSGMIIETLKIFSMMHKPLFIPFSKISEVQNGKSILTCTEFKIDDKKIVIYGKAGEELFSKIQSNDLSS